MLEALNAMNTIVAEGVIETYAIGGAIAAAFYIEAMQSEDVDVFVFIKPSDSGLLTLTPIYDALVRQGGVVEGVYVRFGAWPVQVLPDANELVAEAIRESVEVTYDESPTEHIRTRIFTAEHLCAVALQTGRRKDYLRVGMFLDQHKVDPGKLGDLARRFGLVEQLKRVEVLP